MFLRNSYVEKTGCYRLP